MNKHFSKQQSGFTLIEILVSTTIFVLVVAALLTLFNYTLKINRRVQALREVVQGSRTFTETLTREIRNGRIDYTSWNSHCDYRNYADDGNQSLAILTRTGDRLCFYLDNSSHRFYIVKRTATGDNSQSIFDSDRFRLNATTFRMYVRPTTDPEPESGSNPGIQPFVTILAQFQLQLSPTSEITTINYQTTVSTDVYDIPQSSSGPLGD